MYDITVSDTNVIRTEKREALLLTKQLLS